MARQQVTLFTDDLTGDEIPSEEVSEELYVVKGTLYQIDLGPNGRKMFEEMVQPLLDKSRVVRRIRLDADKRVSVARPAVDRDQNQAVRTWARENSIKVSERGRIPAGVLEKYHEEN